MIRVILYVKLVALCIWYSFSLLLQPHHVKSMRQNVTTGVVSAGESHVTMTVSSRKVSELTTLKLINDGTLALRTIKRVLNKSVVGCRTEVLR